MNTKDFFELNTVKHILLDIKSNLGNRFDHIDTYPPKEFRFLALDITPIEMTKVVILGQDPYHHMHQAHGLAFSSMDSNIPKSLANIFKAVSLYQPDVDVKNTDLTRWAKQGVLLWNVYLSVEKGKPLSHAIQPYEKLTELLIQHICLHQKHVVFMLWGQFAQSFKSHIQGKHLILEAPHPSPLSVYRGFYERDMFRMTNAYLTKHDIKGIDWR